MAGEQKATSEEIKKLQDTLDKFNAGVAISNQSH
jgi:hypothetical protein